MSETISYKKPSKKITAQIPTSPIVNQTAVTLNESNLPIEKTKGAERSQSGTGVGSSSSRRKALKDFYKLQELQKQELAQVGKEGSDIQKVNEGAKTDKANEPKEAKIPPKVLSLDNIDDFLAETDFIKLVEIENEITDALNSNQSEIKSIIYNNYYELIKINDVLKNLINKNSNSISVVKNAGKEEFFDDNDDDNEIKIGEDESSESVIDSLNNIKKNIQSLKSVDMSVLTNSDLNPDKEIEKIKMTKQIDNLVLSRRLPKPVVEKVEKILPKLKGESIILQMNEIKEKGYR
ncbi:unnamed protein product [[Candida] boidinii]|uniref:Unnamed protein product n=1 Tax=Candida boidinii TaxID=5477 RepID=A0A9W6SV85_CANBO|nr:hypothetical protein B5S30_g1537 [[Candida] boidinii]GME66951.1 unnamed protein product [[Candida] boidinii]GMG00292.1 unnamed protein product [[Candida] boidinii]